MRKRATTRKLPRTYKGKSTRPGGGGRFSMAVDTLIRKGYSPKKARAIMAAKGRAKYGAKKMGSWSARGRTRSKGY